MPARKTAELLLQVGRLVQAEGYDGELSPAQWMALRYFARANPFSRNPSAFAEFQATTRGTAAFAAKPWIAWWCAQWTASTRARTCSLSILKNASTVAFANRNVPSMPSRLIPNRGLINGYRSMRNTRKYGQILP